ncbi:hypothetical protein SPRG_03725 [Saprolegnia parasitica CBS 223.65]|uniref:UDENN domain-containing protein n=1 Tax=Saprolegnia parasitica (strain CBS 223.65) TaxID=695850 RepID=A0A067CRD9_SAPPC|nr:hypothetical protein SPRG_03725 [Saprolegnia parasitica CBS 223.65]KDO31805.1 hypothetical protein SPRG_03725 [Saprolegnia parasitica CBS 223.65]|eukprot:XP_012197685.1 hypothetical protein SPRG_03725 [Saprolegnia parasitica CBS 223.65]
MATDPTSTTAPRRLVEYFFVATKTGAGDEALTFQYPATTEADEYPPNILMFMFPCTSSPAHGSLLPPPVYNTFVLTTASGAALYGTSICFSTLTSSSDVQHTLTSLCFVSQWPFCGPLLKYLEQLALLGVHQARQVDYTGVEKSLANLFFEVPLPVRGRAGVVASIGDTDVLLKRYTMQDVPFEMDMEFLEYTFAILTPDTLLNVLCHLLLEHAVLIVGVDTLFVTAVAETLRHLLFPLQWDHVFIPVVPLGVDMATLLDAPVPFVAGAHPLQLEGAALPPTVVRVDLPEGRVTSAIELPPLPDAVVAMKDRLATVLKKTSSQLSRRLWERRMAFQKALYSNNKGDLMYERGKFLLGSSALVRKVAKSFTHLIGDLVAGHEHCLRGDVVAYVCTKPASQQAFYTALADTNAFQAFLDGMASPHEASRAVRFFRLQHPPTTIKSPLLSPTAQENSQFHVAMAPDTPALQLQNDASNLQFHVTFPNLDVAAFGPVRQLTEIEPDDDVDCVLVGRRSSSTVTTPEARASVLDWLDTWLRSSEKGKAVQSVFRRTKTLGSPTTRPSPLHRTQSQNASRRDGASSFVLCFLDGRDRPTPVAAHVVLARLRVAGDAGHDCA